MIRERRTREKLQSYYRKYLDQGVLDPNVHPWVAEAWEKSRAAGVAPKNIGPFVRLSGANWDDRLSVAEPLIRQLDGLYDTLRDFFSLNNISLLLLDRDCYVLKSYAMSYYQKTPGELAGARLAEKDIGASSIGIALSHKTPFFLYGPEIWLEECHESDAATVPILRDGQVRYLLTMVMMDGAEKREGKVALGGGPVLSRGANINPVLYEHLRTTAKKRKIPVQIVADGRATPTDADPIQISRAGVAAALVSIPLRYMHTPGEIVAIDDLDQTAELLAHAIAAMKPGQKWIPF